MFKSWLISNIEWFLFFLGIIAILTLCPKNSDWIAGAFKIIGFYIILYGLLMMLADSGAIGSIFIGLAGIGLSVLGIFYSGKFVAGWFSSDVAEKVSGVLTAYTVSGTVTVIVCFVLAVLVAVFAFINFDDVVDLRWLYRHSDMAIYESEWLYALNRFGVTLVGSICVAAMIALMIYARTNVA